MKAELRFDNRIVGEPIISSVILKKRAPINILRAKVNEKGGNVLIEVPDEAAEEVFEALASKGVKVERKILIEILETCIDCGHCITLCPVEAIYAEKDLSVKVDEKKCIHCRRCVDACPVRAIKISI